MDEIFMEQPQAEEQAAAPAQAGNFLSKLNLKLIIPIVAVIAVLAIAIPILYGVFFNNYKTPLKMAAKIENAKTYDAQVKATINASGFLKKEVKGIYNIVKKSEEFDLDEERDDYKEMVEDLEEEYGKNYKFYIEVEDKEKLDKDDLKDYKDELKDTGKAMKSQYEDLDSDDIEDMADYMGLSKSNAKKLVKLMESAAKKMRSAKVTAGYELSVKYMVKGSELDEPEELYEDEIVVLKINGKWVNLDDLDMDLF